MIGQHDFKYMDIRNQRADIHWWDPWADEDEKKIMSLFHILEINVSISIDIEVQLLGVVEGHFLHMLMIQWCVEGCQKDGFVVLHFYVWWICISNMLIARYRQ